MLILLANASDTLSQIPQLPGIYLDLIKTLNTFVTFNALTIILFGETTLLIQKQVKIQLLV